MYIRIGRYSINLAALVAVNWDARMETPGSLVALHLQGSEIVLLEKEEIESFKAAFEQLMTLEQAQQSIGQQMEQLAAAWKQLAEAEAAIEKEHPPKGMRH